MVSIDGADGGYRDLPGRSCQGRVLDQVPTSKGMPGFAFGYAVAGFVPDQGSRTKPGGADGVDHAEGRGEWP